MCFDSISSTWGIQFFAFTHKDGTQWLKDKGLAVHGNKSTRLERLDQAMAAGSCAAFETALKDPYVITSNSTIHKQRHAPFYLPVCIYIYSTCVRMYICVANNHVTKIRIDRIDIFPYPYGKTPFYLLLVHCIPLLCPQDLVSAELDKLAPPAAMPVDGIHFDQEAGKFVATVQLGPGMHQGVMSKAFVDHTHACEWRSAIQSAHSSKDFMRTMQDLTKTINAEVSLAAAWSTASTTAQELRNSCADGSHNNNNHNNNSHNNIHKYIYVPMYIHTYIHTYIYIHTYTHRYMYIHTCIYVHTPTHMNVHR